MKRITICIDDDVLKKARRVQSEIQVNEDLSVSLSNVIASCVLVAIESNKNKVKDAVSITLTRT
jgi:hypothetical protein